MRGILKISPARGGSLEGSGHELSGEEISINRMTNTVHELLDMSPRS